MSHVAIAAALALEDVSAGERLAAFSLASFANREHRAWPGTRIAAARAGLSRSQYLAVRDSLQRHGQVVIEESGGGRGNAPVVAMVFAQTGPWFDGEVNAELFEAVLGYSRTRGAARLLLATLAAVADDELVVAGLATDQLRAAGGMADSTYRRARAALLTSGELALKTAGGGRARTNRWKVRDPRADGQPAVAPRTRVTPSRTARPLIATVHESAAVETRHDAPEAGSEGVKGPGLSGVSVANPAQDRTVCDGKGPGLTGVSAPNPAQDRTVSCETPPQTPPETPPPNARAGREPQNPRTSPPSPPDGGSHTGSVTIVGNYITDRGRKRQRSVAVDVDQIRSRFRQPDDAAHTDWQRIRSELRRVVGESTFEIWLDQLELRATDQGSFLVSAAPATRSWVATRFGRLLDRVASSVGRQLRLADGQELQMLDAISPRSRGADTSSHVPTQTPHDQKEAV